MFLSFNYGVWEVPSDPPTPPPSYLDPPKMSASLWRSLDPRDCHIYICTALVYSVVQLTNSPLPTGRLPMCCKVHPSFCLCWIYLTRFTLVLTRLTPDNNPACLSLAARSLDPLGQGWLMISDRLMITPMGIRDPPNSLKKLSAPVLSDVAAWKNDHM